MLKFAAEMHYSKCAPLVTHLLDGKAVKLQKAVKEVFAVACVFLAAYFIKEFDSHLCIRYALVVI